MKSFVIYIKGNSKSEEYAKVCLDSCKDKFDAELFEGVTPFTLKKYEEKYNFIRIQPSRVNNFYNENKKLFHTKKSCFMNHVRLWHKCLELNKPIAVIEQDSFCLKKWDNTQFEELLILNVESAFNQKVFDHVWKKKSKPCFEIGLNEYKTDVLTYYFENMFNGYSMMPGTAAYGITPKGAKKLLDSLTKHGWEQSDYFINNYNVKIQTMMPEYFSFKLKNLNMSHGI